MRTDHRASLASVALLLAACQGYVGETPHRPGDGDDILEGVVLPAPQTRVPRLTHDQWEATVRDLLRLDRETGLVESLRVDSLPGDAVFTNRGDALEVDEVLWGNYQRAAAELADRVTADTALLARLLPPGAPMDEAGAALLVRELGLRAHRRPLEPTEHEEYMTLYRRGPGLYGALDAFRAGVRLVLEAMLQSPHLLYRVELSTARVEGVVPLDDFEVASRLSYALWGTMPDEELFAAAAAGMLRDPAGVEVQARRMLDDPRAERAIVDFHRQLFDVRTFGGIAPSPERFPDASAELARYAAEEHDLFVREIVLGRDGGYRDLLTSTTTFANDELARIYGLSGSFGAELVPVSLDASERRGVFTQVGFLASNATRTDPDPIHRGVYLAERIACIHINAPPADTPPVSPLPGRTNRQIIEEHTEQPGSICAGCHAQIINPFGFPFESYDAIGGWRTEDNGFSVDTSASPPIDGVPTPVRGAVELAEALAESQWAHECYVRHWIEYALGRHAAPEDTALVTELGERSRTGELPVRDLIVTLVTSRAFLTRNLREVSP